MFGRKKRNQLHHHIDTLIGANTNLTGDIHFTGGLRVDGHIVGNVIAAGGEHDTLVLSNEGSISGKISVANVVINGTVNGPIRAPGYLELQESAKVYGDVQYGLLEIHLGASVQGKMVQENFLEDEHAKHADKMITLIANTAEQQHTSPETDAK